MYEKKYPLIRISHHSLQLIAIFFVKEYNYGIILLSNWKL
jgi:hypothetical protein